MDRSCVAPSPVRRLALVAQTLPERELHRVIGDGDAQPDGEVDGEDLGDVEEVVFECERGAVSVLV